MDSRTYIAIDLKSFYASAECVARGLDPLTARLVVADESRTDRTICLAVSPALKAFGIPGRPRLFEVQQRLQVVNAERRHRHLEEVDFIAAKPRMAHYMAVSAQVYRVYLQYIAPEDIHVYSIDEVFIDATAYLKTYRCTAHELTIRMIRDVLRTTGITATAGIGSNLYLAKIAMDIEAKHAPADADERHEQALAVAEQVAEHRLDIEIEVLPQKRDALQQHPLAFARRVRAHQLRRDTF